jgi:hypothetical protein
VGIAQRHVQQPDRASHAVATLLSWPAEGAARAANN